MKMNWRRREKIMPVGERCHDRMTMAYCFFIFLSFSFSYSCLRCLLTRLPAFPSPFRVLLYLDSRCSAFPSRVSFHFPSCRAAAPLCLQPSYCLFVATTRFPFSSPPIGCYTYLIPSALPLPSYLTSRLPVYTYL